MSNLARLIEAQNAALREEFINVAAKAGWCFLSRTDAFSPFQTGHAFVAGFALWNRSDLLALKQLVTKEDGGLLKVYLFDVDEFGFSDETEKFILGVKMPVTTPVMTEYNAGILIEVYEARDVFDGIDKL